MVKSVCVNPLSLISQRFKGYCCESDMEKLKVRLLTVPLNDNSKFEVQCRVGLNFLHETLEIFPY